MKGNNCDSVGHRNSTLLNSINYLVKKSTAERELQSLGNYVSKNASKLENIAPEASIKMSPN